MSIGRQFTQGRSRQFIQSAGHQFEGVACDGTNYGTTLVGTHVPTNATGDRDGRSIVYDPDHDVFYHKRTITSASGVHCRDANTFAQLWALDVGAGSAQQNCLYVPETGFLYFCNSTSGLYEIDVTSHLSTRLLSGISPYTLCYRSSDRSLFLASQLNNDLVKVDADSMAVVGMVTPGSDVLNFPFYCPINDRIYVHGRNTGLYCINPDTLALEATIAIPSANRKRGTFSCVSGQIYLCQFPTAADPTARTLHFIDPATNAIVSSISVSSIWPTNGDNSIWHCQAIGRNVHVYSPSLITNLVINATDNSSLGSFSWGFPALEFANGKDTTQGVVANGNSNNGVLMRLNPP